MCRGFNYIDNEFLQRGNEYREVNNCELSERDTRDFDVQNNNLFDYSNFNFYERHNSRSISDNEADCLDGIFFYVN